MAKRTSLKDIANAAGVSISLVSYVLNGKNTQRINAGTAERIKQLAKELNYQPNQLAKDLKNQKTYTIGLIVADISNFFYSYIAGFIEEEATKYGYNVVFGSAYEDPIRFRGLLDVMVSRQVDGLILAIPEGAESSLAYIKHLSVPYILIDREFPEFGDFDTISLDNYKSSATVAKKFAELGCKRVAGIGLASNLFHLQERYKGFIETAGNLIGSDNVSMFEIPENAIINKFEEVVNKLIKEERVDGICCFTNKIAMIVLPLLLSYNIKIPNDLVVICYDEVDAYKLFPYPMFYVRQPLKEMSIEAVKCLLDTNTEKNLRVKRFDAELIEMKGY